MIRDNYYVLQKEFEAELQNALKHYEFPKIWEIVSDLFDRVVPLPQNAEFATLKQLMSRILSSFDKYHNVRANLFLKEKMYLFFVCAAIITTSVSFALMSTFLSANVWLSLIVSLLVGFGVASASSLFQKRIRKKALAEQSDVAFIENLFEMVIECCESISTIKNDNNGGKQSNVIVIIKCLQDLLEVVLCKDEILDKEYVSSSLNNILRILGYQPIFYVQDTNDSLFEIISGSNVDGKIMGMPAVMSSDGKRLYKGTIYTK